MNKLIYIIILIAVTSCFGNAQDTTVWLNGSKTDPSIIKQKSQIEAKGLKVFINDVAEREKRHSIKIINSGDEKFDRIFREGRDLMDKEEWAKAAAKFNEIACDCPDNKQVDAALYWLAFCYNKQKMYKESAVAIERLLKNFPNSDWADDARVLSYQVRAARPFVTSVGSGQSGSVYTTSGTAYETAVAGTYNIAQQTPLDREDEIKLAAFQSLIAADPKKGIETLGNILGSGSKASENLKIQILRTLRGSRFGFSRTPAFNSSNGLLEATIATPTPTTVVTELNPMLRDTLAKSYQSESSAKVRAEIIYTIASMNDEASVNYLAQLYSNESSKDLKKSIINGLGGSTYSLYSDLHPYTLTTVGGFNQQRTISDTQKAKVEAETAAVAPRPTNTSSKTQNTNPVRELRFNKLTEIFRNEKDLELKTLAFASLQRFVGWSNKDGIVEMLAQMYDAGADDNFKVSIIYSFGNLPQNSKATNKLLDIAKNDKSDKMRLEAIRALRNNNSPEVLKFLEDLIK
ncbi:MAG: tetratricopeptide repeat protein [Pyrinomonadaceae bacterium]|nr:tetratricopeptide repeat protein [Pyrinomonadaceae bacterium]